MKKKNYLILDDEFLMYCEINNITDIDKLAKETFNRGFTILKYGEIPLGNKDVKIIEKEKIVEVEKEIIKEVPIEKIVEIIKEVPIQGDNQIVVKEVLVKDEEEIKRLTDENKKLIDELETIKKSLENFSKAKYMKNSDMSSLYGE